MMTKQTSCFESGSVYTVATIGGCVKENLAVVGSLLNVSFADFTGGVPSISIISPFAPLTLSSPLGTAIFEYKHESENCIKNAQETHLLVQT